MSLRILSLTLLLAGAAPAQFTDRILKNAWAEPVSNKGTFRIVAIVDVMTTDTVPPGDLSFRLVTTNAMGVAVGDEMVNVQVVAHSSCTSAAPPTCGGTCPSGTVNGNAVAGSCEPYLIMVVGCSPNEICACWYRDITVDAVDEIEAESGEKLTVTLVPVGAPDHVCSPANETLDVLIGSVLDDPGGDVDPGTGRHDSPLGGQADDPGADGPEPFLDQVGLVRQGDGPYEYWGTPGTMVTCVQQLSFPAGGAALFFGTPRTTVLELPDGSIDVELPFSGTLHDSIGITSLLVNPPVLSGPPLMPNAAGRITFDYTLSGPSGYRISMQGVNLDPASPVGFRVTSRNDVAIQPAASAAGPPQLPPFPPPTAWPTGAEVIVPNNGQTSTGTGASDGTLFSVRGRGFDATDPSTAAVTVNNIAADVWLVRPAEILFRLRGAHESGVGGPVEVTSTGGTFIGNPERMEHWVLATPSDTLVFDQLQLGSLAGGWRSRPGLKAGRGTLDGSTPTVLWDLNRVLPGAALQVFLGEVDPVSGQVRSVCTLAACPPLPGPFGDPLVRHLDVALATQGFLDDEGPGLNPFGTFTAVANKNWLEVGRHPPPSAFSYLILVSW